MATIAEDFVTKEEKIRKQIKAFIKSRGSQITQSKTDAWLSWLEKQVEPNPYSGVSFKYNDHTWGMCARDNGVDILCDKHIIGHLEKQGEQNPADKDEPKFKVGDWIVYNDNLYHIDNIALQRYYECLRVDGTVHTFSLDIDSKSHLWAIQDANDGDVLVVDNMIFIYERTLASHIVSYCKLINDIFEPFDDARTCCEDNPYVHPATKEQRDFLFKKMKEAGYEWDADEKKLKKIEQDAWTEEDKKMFLDIESLIHSYRTGSYEHELSSWFESLKDRVMLQPKQEWKQENISDLTDFENAMMHIGGSFFGDNAGLDPNNTNVIKEQASLLLELVPKQKWTEHKEK